MKYDILCGKRKRATEPIPKIPKTEQENIQLFPHQEIKPATAKASNVLQPRNHNLVRKNIGLQNMVPKETKPIRKAKKCNAVCCIDFEFAHEVVPGMTKRQTRATQFGYQLGLIRPLQDCFDLLRLECSDVKNSNIVPYSLQKSICEMCKHGRSTVSLQRYLQAPDFREIMNEFVDEVNDLNLRTLYVVAHNNGSDKKIFDEALDKYELSLNCEIVHVNSLPLFQKKLKLDSHSMKSICKHFQIVQRNAHDAGDDVACLWEALTRCFTADEFLQILKQ